MTEAESQSHRFELDLAEDEEHPSRLWMVFASLGALGLLAGVCLCGFGLYFFQPVFNHDPAHVAELTQELISIDLSDDWQPGGTIEWNVLWMMMFRGAYYEWKDAQGQLAIVAVDGQVLDQQDVRSHVVRQLQEAGGTGVVVVEQEESREVLVDGEPVMFVFQQGKDVNSEILVRLVEGVVNGSRGPVLIALRINQSAWDEQRILHMLSTLRPH